MSWGRGAIRRLVGELKPTLNNVFCVGTRSTRVRGSTSRLTHVGVTLVPVVIQWFEDVTTSRVMVEDGWVTVYHRVPENKFDLYK